MDDTPMVRVGSGVSPRLLGGTCGRVHAAGFVLRMANNEWHEDSRWVVGAVTLPRRGVPWRSTHCSNVDDGGKGLGTLSNTQ